MSEFHIRSVKAGDWDNWLPLWLGYQEFYRIQLTSEINRTTWARFFDPDEPMCALVAEREGELIGVVHYLFHRNTWMLNPVCYLQDLFTAPEARGGGVGRALIETVYARAREAGSPRVYWMTHESNSTGRALYDKVAERSGFIQYRKALT